MCENARVDWDDLRTFRIDRIGAAEDAIEQTRGWVGTQGVVNMSPTDHIGLRIESLHIVEIRNGQWVPVD